MRDSLTIVIFVFANFLLLAQPQNGLVAYYSFESCNAKDVSLNNSDGIVFGDPFCDCGVEGNGLYFDGVDDYAAITGNVEAYFEDTRFTLSLYFRLDDNQGTYDILSKRTDCDFDHSFSVRYTPSSRTLAVELSESNDRRTTFTEQIDDPLCWIHLVVVKDDRSHRIYINSKLLTTQSIDDFLDLTTSAPLQIGNSPCVGSTDKRFKGWVDEMRVYNRILDDEEIKDLYLHPDQIVTLSTTISQGNSIDLDAGTSCADQITWSPVAQLSPSDMAQTTASPSSTQSFVASYHYPTCTAQDTVLINVVNPGEIECGKVPMPNAFTPNADGRNDVFFISNPFAVQELHAFEIFDRIGNKVFGTSNVADSWDGTYHGQDVNPGLFLYKIRYSCQGEKLTKTGSVMVMR